MSTFTSKGKEKRRKGRGERRRGGGRAGGGVDEGWRPDIENDGCVEVIFVDELVRFFKMLDSSDDRIPPTFLQDILDDCYRHWQPHIPGIHALDLVAKPFPRFPANGSTFRDWKGVILVELKEEKVDLGPIKKISSLAGELMAVEFQRKTDLDSINARIKAAIEAATSEVKDNNRQMGERLEVALKLIQELRQQQEASDASIEKLKESHVETQERIKDLNDTLKTHILLTNKVKQRVILAKARYKIIGTLGKPKPLHGQSWKDFFKSFQPEDWVNIFGDKEEDVLKMEKVKKLLGVGPIDANKSIHQIEYEELNESIFAVELGKDQGAWAWLLAFGFSMTLEDVMGV